MSRRYKEKLVTAGRFIAYKQSRECVDISDITYRGQKIIGLRALFVAGKQLHDDPVPVQAVLPNWGRRPFPAAFKIRNVQFLSAMRLHSCVVSGLIQRKWCCMPGDHNHEQDQGCDTCRERHPLSAPTKRQRKKDFLHWHLMLFPTQTQRKFYDRAPCRNRSQTGAES
jgi:hypothetical protein